MADEMHNDLREIIKHPHAYFFLLKGDEATRLRLWDVREDSIVIDIPKDAPMRKTVLGYIPLIEGNGVYEMEGELDAEPFPDQMPDTMRLKVDPERVKQLNRRVYPRASFTPPLQADLSWSGRDKKIAGRIINLSAGGLRVETLEELPPELPINFDFEVECDDEIHVISLTGKIVYDIPMQTGHAYGVKFLREQDQEDYPIKEATIQTLDETIDLMRLVNKLRQSNRKRC